MATRLHFYGVSIKHFHTIILASIMYLYVFPVDDFCSV